MAAAILKISQLEPIVAQQQPEFPGQGLRAGQVGKKGPGAGAGSLCSTHKGYSGRLTLSVNVPGPISASQNHFEGFHSKDYTFNLWESLRGKDNGKLAIIWNHPTTHLPPVQWSRRVRDFRGISAVARAPASGSEAACPRVRRNGSGASRVARK
jgi:hypothetical protein